MPRTQHDEEALQPLRGSGGDEDDTEMTSSPRIDLLRGRARWQTGSSGHGFFGRLRAIRGTQRVALIGVVTLFLLVIGFSVHKTRASIPWEENYQGPENIEEDLDLDFPPRYNGLIQEQANLPQHNLSLPLPEGERGRYVKFTSQVNMLGWNNVFNELLMLTHLAYRSQRTYVFQDYVWKQDYYPWPEEKAWVRPSRTPLGALIAGPTAGGSWGPGDAAPRSIHESFWEVVCPREKVKVISTHDVKTQFDLYEAKSQFDTRVLASGRRVFEVWNKLLLEEQSMCVEVVPPPMEVAKYPQVFDLWLWGTTRILDMWEEFRDSPVSQLLRASPVVERAVHRNLHTFKKATEIGERKEDPFSRVFAVHIRRGDYVDACTSLANWNSTFYSWNLLPYLPDRFGPLPGGSYGQNTPENTKEYFVHCLPDEDQIIRRITGARRDWEMEKFGKHLTDHFVNTLFILTNAKSQWLDDFIAKLKSEHQWNVVTSHDIVFGDSQEKDVGMAVDMEMARRAAIFMGNGWSSFTSNIVHRRLVDRKTPISNRFF